MKRNLAIAVICLFAVWLGSLAVLLCFLAQIVGVPFLVGAIVAQIGVAAISAGLLIETNTRRAWPADPFGFATDELIQRGVQLPSGQVFGRRDDDRPVVDRLSEILEQEAAKRPASERTPWWIEERRGQPQDDEIPLEEL